MKILLNLLLLILTFQINFGQEKPKARLVFSFQELPCDALKMMTYGFLDELSKESTSTGYAVINEGKDGRNPKNWVEEIIFLSSYQYHRFSLPKNKDLLKIVYGKKGKHFRVEFWKVPNEAEKPKYLRESSLYSVPKSTKPFLFAVSYEGRDGCPDFHPEIFADAMKSNRNLKGHIVIFNLSKQIRKERIEYLEKLFQENKISHKQFKVFLINNKKKPSITEFWLVPKKKNY